MTEPTEHRWIQSWQGISTVIGVLVVFGGILIARERDLAGVATKAELLVINERLDRLERSDQQFKSDMVYQLSQIGELWKKQNAMAEQMPTRREWEEREKRLDKLSADLAQLTVIIAAKLGGTASK